MAADSSKRVILFVLFVDEDCACRTIRVMINGQEAELTIIDIPYIEMSVSLKKNSRFQNVRGEWLVERTW